MSTHAQDVAGETAPGLVAVRPRRGRRWIVGGAAVLLILAGAAYLITANTQRLEFGGVYGYNPTDGVSMFHAGRTTELRFPFRPNSTFTFRTSIRNPGRWPVQVTDVSLQGWAGGPYYAVEKLLYGYDDGNNRDAYLPEHASSWQPVTVAPDRVLALFLTIKIPNVEMATGSSVNWETVGVRYKVLGLSQEQRVPIGFFLSVGP